MGNFNCMDEENSINRPGDKQKIVIWGDYFNLETRMILATLKLTEDVDYGMILIDSLKNEQKKDKSYKKINPTGKIPTVVEG